METGIFIDSLTSSRAWFIAVLTLAGWLFSQLPRLVGLLVVIQARTLNRLPVLWLAGAGVGGYVAMFVIDHDGFSQTYFALASMPFLCVLSSIAISDWIERAPTRETLPAFAVGAILALAYHGLLAQFVDELGLAGSVALAVGILSMSAALLVGRVHSWRRTATRAAYTLTALIIGASLPSVGKQLTRDLGGLLGPRAHSVDQSSATYVSPNEQAAMLWLRSVSGNGDRQVTNLHCIPPADVAACDARGFWVVGLSGVPAALEGYGYTSESQSKQGIGGLRGVNQPPPSSPAADLSRRLFADPSDSVVRELRDRHGVDWIVVVDRAGAAPELGGLQEVRQVFDNGDVVIYSTHNARAPTVLDR